MIPPNWDTPSKDSPGIAPLAVITPGTVVPGTVEPVVDAVTPLSDGFCIKAGLFKRDSAGTPSAVRKANNKCSAQATLPSRIWHIMCSAIFNGWDVGDFLCWLK